MCWGTPVGVLGASIWDNALALKFSFPGWYVTVKLHRVKNNGQWPCHKLRWHASRGYLLKITVMNPLEYVDSCCCFFFSWKEVGALDFESLMSNVVPTVSYSSLCYYNLNKSPELSQGLSQNYHSHCVNQLLLHSVSLQFH